MGLVDGHRLQRGHDCLLWRRHRLQYARARRGGLECHPAVGVLAAAAGVGVRWDWVLVVSRARLCVQCAEGATGVVERSEYAGVEAADCGGGRVRLRERARRRKVGREKAFGSRAERSAQRVTVSESGLQD